MSRIRANNITNLNANGAPNFPDGITVTGVITATSFIGVAQVGVASEGSFVGAGASMLDFKTTTGTNINNVTVDSTSGIATVTIQPGVSLGLAIALGG